MFTRGEAWARQLIPFNCNIYWILREERTRKEVRVVSQQTLEKETAFIAFQAFQSTWQTLFERCSRFQN